jgi:hypothetical protein
MNLMFKLCKPYVRKIVSQHLQILDDMFIFEDKLKSRPRHFLVDVYSERFSSHVLK